MKNVIRISKSKKSFLNRKQLVKQLSLVQLCLCLVLSVFNLNAQESQDTDQALSSKTIVAAANEQEDKYTVKGIVLDEDDLPLLGVNVVLKNSAAGTVTDDEGKFEFPRTLDVGDVLVFSYIGYQPKEYKIKANESKRIEVNIAFKSSDLSLMGAVEVEGEYESKPNIFQRFLALFK